MDDRLIAQVNATAKSLRDAAKAADKELSDAQEERKTIDARIEQLRSLRDQLESAIAEAEGTASGGRRTPGGTRGPARKKAARRKSTRKKATSKKAASKKATSKKAASRKTAGRRASRSNGAGRSDAVVGVLARASGPMRPAQVAEQMRAAGRDDTSSQVSATLSHLARTGKVSKVGDGVYAAS